MSYAALPVMMLGVHKMLGTQPGQLAKVDQKDISYHVASCSATKARVKKGEGKDIWSDGIYPPKKPLCVMSPVLLEVAEVSVNGKQ